MALQLACADFTFPLLSHDDSLQLIKLLGVDVVDVGFFQDRSHLQPGSSLTHPQRSGAALRQALERYGMTASGIYLQMSLDLHEYAINNPDPARRDHAADWFRKTLDYVLAAGCHHLTMLPGVPFGGEETTASLARSVEELTWRVGEASDRGIVVAVEPHIGSIVDVPDRTAQLCQDVPGLTLALDYTHFIRDGYPDEHVHPLLAHSSILHARGGRPGRIQTSMAENTVDYAAVLDQMQQVGYDGPVVLEYTYNHWEYCDENDNVSETVLLRDQLLAHPLFGGSGS